MHRSIPSQKSKKKTKKHIFNMYVGLNNMMVYWDLFLLLLFYFFS